MKYFTRIGDDECEFSFERRAGELWAHSGGRSFRIDLSLIGDGSAFSLLVDGKSHDCLVHGADGATVVLVDGERVVVEVEDERERTAHRVASSKPVGRRTIDAVMPGIVVEVKVAVGDVVADGETLLVLEAMKMQNPIHADGPGRVTRLHVAPGQTVGGGAALVELDAP